MPAQLINNLNDELTHRKPMIKGIPCYPNPTYRPPPKPVRIPTPECSVSLQSSNINNDINFDLEENSPYQEGIISETYH